MGAFQSGGLRHPPGERNLAKKPIRTDDRQKLRAEAEARLVRDPKGEAKGQPSFALLHELQVHQIELEMQNEELRLDRIGLAKAHERLVDLYDFAPVGYLTLDAKGVITAANLTSATLLGIERKKLLQRPFSGLMSQEGSDHWHRFFASLAQPGSSHGAVDLPLHRADGTAFDAHLVCDLHGTGDAEREVRIALANVSEAKRLEEALAASEERFRAFIERSSDVTMVVDEKGNFTFVSPAFQSLMGLSPSEVIGRSAFAFNHPDDAPKAMEALAAAMRDPGSTQCVQVRVRRADGSWALLDASITNMLAVPSVRGFVVNNRDISERKRAEEALRESEHRFRQLANELPVGIFQVGPNGDMQFVSPTWLKITGLSEAEAFGANAGMAIHPEDRGRVSRLWQDATSSGKVFSDEYRLRGRDGKETWVRGFGTAVRDEDGTVTSYVGALIDISEAHRLQAELAQASRLAAMGTLVAGVAHEINNPLAATLANQGLALELARGARDAIHAKIPTDPDHRLKDLDEVIEALAEAQESGQRIAQIVKDMATFANPNPKRTLVRLTDVVQGAMRWFPTSMGQSGRIQVEDGGAPEVMAASGQLEQVVHNLITNAARASAESGGEVVVGVGPGSPGMACLEVVDHGVGIPEKDFDRIFEPFYTTRRAGEGRGAGLGLAISRAIVIAHGGTISVKSEVGKGSTFRVELPVAPAEA